MRLTTLILAALTTVPTISHAFELGVLAPRGEAQALAEWTPFAEHLSEELGVQVNLSAYAPVPGTEAFAVNRIDVLIGNPVQTAVVTDTMRGVPIMSVHRASGQQFAGVILARADSGVTEASDIRDLRIGTLGEWAAGGFVFQAAYLADAGIDVRAEAAEHYKGTDQIELVEKLLAGQLDVVFVRTGIVERLEKDGRLSLDDIVILNETREPGFPLVRTTPLYPEWFVVTQDSFDIELRSQLAQVLGNIGDQDDAAQAANIRGFVAPLDVSTVVAAMRAARVPPYN